MEKQKGSAGQERPVFETSNLDLGAYLMLEGLQYLGCYIDVSGPKPLAKMQFLDSKQNAHDLERNFMTSSEKRYRDLTKYLLKEVHREMRKDPGGSAQRSDS